MTACLLSPFPFSGFSFLRCLPYICRCDTVCLCRTVILFQLAGPIEARSPAKRCTTRGVRMLSPEPVVGVTAPKFNVPHVEGSSWRHEMNGRRQAIRAALLVCDLLGKCSITLPACPRAVL